MERKLLIFIMMCCMLLSAQATDKLSNTTKKFIQERLIKASLDSTEHREPQKGSQMVSAFIRLNGNAIDQLATEGVVVNAVFSDFVTAQFPISNIDNIAALDVVREICIPENMTLYTDKARDVTNVTQALAGTGLDQAYDGTGVIAGIIDTGIDFNHAAFQDENGNTRIKRVYMPGSYGNANGSTVVINGSVLKGQEFTTAEAISSLTTDTKSESHGTHTASTVAGTIVNGYGGMAPKADIVLCALGDTLSGVNIANSVKYITNYAKSEGKPCVISISLGSQSGPHDGTGYLCKAYNEAAANGAIVCVSSANDGAKKIYYHKVFDKDSTTVPQCATVLSCSSSSAKYYSSVESYSRNGGTYGVRVVVIDATNNSIVYSSNIFTTSKYVFGEGYSQYTGAYSADFAKYFAGYVGIQCGTDSYSGKFNLYVGAYLNKSSQDSTSNNYKIGLVFYGSKGTEIDAWNTDSYTTFTGLSSPIDGYTFTAGTDSCTVGTDATASGVISVGAYVSKKYWTTLAGNTYHYNGSYTVGNIAPFSSYGYDTKGDLHPFITAPGSVLVAAFNSYYSAYANANSAYSVYSQTNAITNKTNYWGAMHGTSMSCPTVAGIVALWLQKNPNLTVDEVKAIMKKTAITDSYTTAGGLRFGNGKIDALGGLEEVGPTETTLKDMVASCKVGDVLKVEGNDLIGVASFTDGTNKYLIVKDGDQAASNYSEIPAGVQTYEIEGSNQENYSQNNWILIKTDDADNYVGKAINSVTGTVSDASNLELTDTEVESGDEASYTPNTYCPVNFMGSSVVSTGSNATTQGSYFFIQPKSNEYARIAYAVYAGDNKFSIPAHDGNINVHDFSGGFYVAYDYCKTTPSFTVGETYAFNAIIKKETPKTSVKGRNKVEARDDAYSTIYTVYPVNYTTNLATGIEDVNAKKTKLNTRYYNMMGVESNTPFAGVNIVVTHYSDGSSTSSKVVM